MANSKVVLADGTVLMDISTDTVTAGALMSGVTAHDSSGSPVTGTLFSVGALWATRDGTLDPANVLGFGTWQKVAPAPMTWNDLKNVTWKNISGVTGGIYVWERTA